MTLYEPTTVATDLALAAVTAVFAAKLVREAGRAGSPALRLWGAGFGASALTALLGGIFHGLGPQIDAARAGALWRATLYAGGATSFLLAAAAVTAARRGQPRRVWIVLVAAKASAYMAVVTARPEFRWLVFEYGSTLLGIAAWQMARRRQPPAPGSGWLLAGIAGAFVAALVQRSGLTLHEHFHHNDLYHVLQMGTAALLYRGAAAIREPSVPLLAS